MQRIGNQTRKTYSEVCEVLELLGDEYIEKIPRAFYENLKVLKLPDYNPKYSEEKSFQEQHISRDAVSMLAFLDYSYWSTTEDEKKELRLLFRENELKSKNDSLFSEPIVENVQLIKKDELKWYQKIVSFFKSKFQK